VLLWADTFNNYFYPVIAAAATEVLEAAGRELPSAHTRTRAANAPIQVVPAGTAIPVCSRHDQLSFPTSASSAYGRSLPCRAAPSLWHLEFLAVLQKRVVDRSAISKFATGSFQKPYLRVLPKPYLREVPKLPHGCGCRSRLHRYFRKNFGSLIVEEEDPY
jgi:hypothetical protein